MTTIEKLREDKQAELGNEYVDVVNYTGLVIIGMYHDIDEKAIVRHINGKISLYKLYYSANGEAYFNYCNQRMYLKNFLLTSL